MIRKIVSVLVLVPLALLIVLFAVANRQGATVSLDPFAANAPAVKFTLPLFVLVLAAVTLGVLIGGIAAWSRQRKWRRRARRAQAEERRLRAEVDALHRRLAAASHEPMPAARPPALRRLPPAA